MSNIDVLRDSLIYQMSLGSKELYHSNVWAWLFENCPDFLYAFGLAEYVHRIKAIKREEGNRDITLYLDSAEWKKASFIIIENKLKSIPNKEQLERYQNSVPEGKFVLGILTGIRKPQIVGDKTDGFLPGWRFVDYEMIGSEIARIAKVLNQVRPPIEIVRENYKSIVEYCRNIKALDGVVGDNTGNHSLEPFNPEPPNGDGTLWRTYDDLGLIDLINKVRAAEFVHHFEAKYRPGLEKGLPKGCRFEIGHGFHNKKNTIDISFHFGGRNEPSDRGIGIQIEGDTFRRFVVYGGADDKEVFEIFLKEGWFSNYKEGKGNKDRAIEWQGMERIKTALTGTHNTYAAGKDHLERKKFFVYQYANPEDWDFDAIAEMVVRHLEVAKEYFHLFE